MKKLFILFIYISIELDVEKWRKTKTTNSPSPISPSPRDENGDMGRYHSSFLMLLPLQIFACCSVGHPWARVLQDSSVIGSSTSCRDIYDSALELILLTLVTAGCFSHFFFSLFTSYCLCPFWNPFPLRIHPFAVGLSHALQSAGWSCLPGLLLTDTALQPSRIKALTHTPETLKYGAWEW